nr:MAG TPA: hypothetical protein [Caudoviricetes sp.]
MDSRLILQAKLELARREFFFIAVCARRTSTSPNAPISVSFVTPCRHFTRARTRCLSSTSRHATARAAQRGFSWSGSSA